MQCVVRYNVHKLLRAKNFFVGTEKQESFDFRGDHFDVKALWCQEATEQERLLGFAVSDAKTQCRQYHSSHRQRGMMGMDSARKVLASRGVGAQGDTKNWIGEVWLRELEQDTQAAEGHSAVDA